jgi:chemotaxis protein histidine kinase CheA
VRDAARRRGKQARLSFVGGEVSFDRRIVEALGTPLLHLVRNAIAHGIEAPDQRAARGKHVEGVISIRFERLATLLFVEVSDDGHGLDTDRIKEAAARRGVSRDRLEAMSPAEVHDLVFLSGLSTSEEVDEVSGRGVGLDAVRGFAGAHGGKIEVQTRAGQGTSFVLTLPVELGSAPLLLVRVGEHVFGLPLLAVETVQHLAQDDVRRADSESLLSFRDALVPLRDLGALLDVRPEVAWWSGQPVVVVAARGRRTALCVDEIVGNADLVMRPLPRGASNVDVFEGAALQGYGRLVLVLRPDWLGTRDRQLPRAAPRILVVDDSLTARANHRSILEAGGYVVHVAGDAARALALLGASRFDAMICDISMEGMNGLDLARAVRSRVDTAALPIVVVSARDGPAEREASTVAGADGFVSKKDCGAGLLLSEVGRVLRPGAGR